MTIDWNHVTWYSKLAAVLLFLATFGVAFYLGAAWQAVRSGLYAPAQSTPESGAPVVGEGEHCGGFIKDAPTCAEGFHCQLKVSSPDTGGTCVADTATSTTGILPYQSGVRGTVTTGPTCPVEQNPPLPQCADKAYATLVAVFRANDAVHAFAIGTSSADGSFSFSLPPGDYTLGAGENNWPRCDHPAVTVPATGYVTANISCDTGIR